MEFSEKLKELRSTKGISQAKLADDIHISRSAVAKWENGLGLPNDESLKMLADYFGVTTSHLLGETAGQHPQEPEEQNEDTAEIADICDKLAQTKAGKARLQFLLEEAQRLLEETEAYEQKRKNLDTK